jgi:hypothetical protein
MYNMQIHKSSLHKDHTIAVYCPRPELSVRQGISNPSAWAVMPLGLVSWKLHEILLLNGHTPTAVWICTGAEVTKSCPARAKPVLAVVIFHPKLS